MFIVLLRVWVCFWSIYTTISADAREEMMKNEFAWPMRSYVEFPSGSSKYNPHKTTARVWNLGMSRSGSTSLSRYLKCKGLKGKHFSGCDNTGPSGKRGGLCAFCVRDALMSYKRNHNVKLEDYCGNFDYFAEYNYKSGRTCIFPSFTHLNEIAKMYPGSKFLLPVRHAWDWLDSLKHFNGMDKRIDNCMREMDIKRVGRTRDEQVMNLYLMHQKKVVDYFKITNNTANLLVYNLTSPLAEQQLNFFLGYAPTPTTVIPQKKQCYGDVNPHKYGKTLSSDSSSVSKLIKTKVDIQGARRL
jgi:hypothetical protein